MTVKFNWPLIASVVGAIAGAVGTILTPLYGADLTNAVQAVLQAVSALLLLLPVHQATTTAAARSQARYSTDMEKERMAYQVELVGARAVPAAQGTFGASS